MASNYNNDSFDSFTPFNAPENPDLLKDVAKKELGETEELKEECLKKLRMLIRDNSVKCITIDDFLLRFLRVQQYDVQSSFELLQNYARHKVAVQKPLQKLQPDTVKTVLQHNIVSILPYHDAKGRLVCFFKLGAWNSDICSDEDVIMTMLLISYYTAERQSSQINGVVIVHTDSLPWNLMNYLIRKIKFLSNFYFNGLPQRYPQIHIVNESALVKVFFQIIRPFLPKEIKETMLFHGESREVLFQHLPPNILPEELGGNFGPQNNDHLIEEIMNFLEKLKDEQRFFLEPNEGHAESGDGNCR